MVDELGLGREFFERLEREDAAIAERVRAASCPRCGGPLYRSDYARKPRGALLAPGADGSVLRYSLCCGREGCRRRATPPSLRFLARRVYAGAVVIAACVAAAALRTAAAIRSTTGVPARTVARWCAWWQGPFVTTEVFVAVAARLVGLVVARIPTAIVEAFPGGATERIAATLELLAPITTSSVPDGSRFLRGAEGWAP